MRSPIESFEKVKEDFIRYYDTAYHVNIPQVEKERDDLLHKDKVLTRIPFIEPMPEYESFSVNGSPVNFCELTREHLDLTDNEISEDQWLKFKDLASIGLFSPNNPLYVHQAEMLKETLKGKNCVITSGTGSGKTESFLLPLFAQLVKEMTRWSPVLQNYSELSLPDKLKKANDLFVANNPNSNRTFLNRHGDLCAKGHRFIATSNGQLTDEARQRPSSVESPNRKAAVRALVIYPMNALVEDQIRRLRSAIDKHTVVRDTTAPNGFRVENDIRDWFIANASGNRLFFGRYNSDAPISGTLRYDENTPGDAPRIDNFYEKLKSIDSNYKKVAKYIVDELPNDEEFRELDDRCKKDLINDHLTFFPRLNGSEMYSRQDMQLTPPDILITNFSMLSITLMRQIEEGIWDKTKDWLDEDPNNVFYIIVDELHLNRGTAGTEQAYMLRMLYKRLGRTPRTSPQIKILASSASLEDNPEGREFVANFFDLDPQSVDDKSLFRIIAGQEKPCDEIVEEKVIPNEPFRNLSIAWRTAREKGSDILTDEFKESCRAIAQGIDPFIGNDVDGVKALLDTFRRYHLKAHLETAFTLNGSKRAIMAYGVPNEENFHRVLSKELFGDLDENAQKEAIDGLFVLRSLMSEKPYKEEYGNYLPRFRNHMFFHNIRGFWASLDKNEIDEQYRADNRPFGKLFPYPVDRTPQGNRVLEVLYCEHCGALFLGGYRSLIKQDDFADKTEWSLLADMPNLEKVPTMTLEEDVLRRPYSQFGIFCPGKKEDMVQHVNPRTGVIEDTSLEWDGVHKIEGGEDPNATGEWVSAYLNIKTGEVKYDRPANMNGHIEGLLYRVIKQNNDAAMRFDKNGTLKDDYSCMPHTCPCCGTNLKPATANSHSRTSPLRGFHTGIAKSTQILSDELMKQLPDEPSKHKLVAFSDSREGAAQLSAGIEFNHFSEIIRQILGKTYRSVFSEIELKQRILAELRQDPQKVREYINTENQTLAVNISAAITNIRQNMAFMPIDNVPSDQYIADIENASVPPISLNRLIVGENNHLELSSYLKEFIKLGINPGGPTKSAEWVDNHHWTYYFNFQRKEWSNANDQYNIALKSLKEFSKILSGRLFYSFEGTGLGYFCINKTAQLEQWIQNNRLVRLEVDELINIANACIRIWIELYKHDKTQDALDGVRGHGQYVTNLTSWPAKIRRWIENVAEYKRVDGDSLKQFLFNLFNSNEAGLRLLNETWGVQIGALYFQFLPPLAQVYWNPVTKIPHLHKGGGICTTAGRNIVLTDDTRERMVLVPATKENGENLLVRDLWQKNYLSYYSMVEQLEPKRLHCEEMTGQTDDQFERQRFFRNIIMDDQLKQVNQIDLLSVTTTLEVGVDIGALQSVLLADMPPQRFNYQQRVGRAGRRGQAFSFVLTFCRDKSHDGFYFEHPIKITGDPSPTPFLSMNNDQGNYDIPKRIIAKEILREFFRELHGDDVVNDSINGEFGFLSENAANWSDQGGIREKLVDWLGRHHDGCLNTIEWIVGRRDINDLNDWVTITNGSCGLVDKMDSILTNKLITTNVISDKLASGGLLPLYGMPTNMKTLFTSNDALTSGPAEQRNKITRDASVAIYEFAPRAQKTKDKEIHTALGFAPGFGQTKPFESTYIYTCPTCGHIMRNDDFDALQNGVCEYCGEHINEHVDDISQVVIPYEYMTSFIKEDSKAYDDQAVYTQSAPSLTENATDRDISTTVKNVYSTFADQCYTWLINDNNGKSFQGDFVPRGTGDNEMVYWVSRNIDNDFRGRRTTGPVNNVSSDSKISIACNKLTNVIRIRLNKQNVYVETNVFNRDPNENSMPGKGTAIKAAFYSAAFILQRSLADKLDITPDEIEISSIQEVMVDNQSSVEIVMNDQLVNGSGFVRQLFDSKLEGILDDVNAIIGGNGIQDDPSNDFLKSLFTRNHMMECSDSCYKCLRVYRNMSFHPVLDWRLGVSLLRMMANEDYCCGADAGLFDYPELSYCVEIEGEQRLVDWLTYAKQLAEEFRGNYYPNATILNSDCNNQGLWYLDTGRKKIVIVHPLWNLDCDRGLVGNCIANFDSNDDIVFIDTFNLQRRQSWCFMKVE